MLTSVWEMCLWFQIPADMRSPWKFSEYSQTGKESQVRPTGDTKLYKRVYLPVYPDSRSVSFEGTPCS